MNYEKMVSRSSEINYWTEYGLHLPLSLWTALYRRTFLKKKVCPKTTATLDRLLAKEDQETVFGLGLRQVDR